MIRNFSSEFFQRLWQSKRMPVPPESANSPPGYAATLPTLPGLTAPSAEQQPQAPRYNPPRPR